MRLALTLSFALTLALASTAAAQSGPDLLQGADQAYSNVEFEGAHDQAAAAIEAGGLSPTELVHAYQLVGVSAAALGDSPGARAAFVMMVSIDPDVRLDDTVPPRLRAPFLEARGTVSAHSRMSAEVQLARAYGALRIALTDPLELVQTVRIHSRIEGSVEFSTTEHDPDAEIMARASGASSADRMEYWLECLDSHGNQLLLLGTEYEPRVVGRTAVADATVGGGGGGGGGDDGGGGGGGGGPGIVGEPVFWIIIGGVVLIGAGIAVGFAVDSQSHVGLATGVRFGF
jgi:hypothetical protein